MNEVNITEDVRERLDHITKHLISDVMERMVPTKPPPPTDKEKLESMKRYLRIQKHITELMLFMLEDGD